MRKFCKFVKGMITLFSLLSIGSPTSAASKLIDSSKLDGKNLKVFLAEIPVTTIKHSNAKRVTDLKEIFTEMLIWLSHSLNFTFTLTSKKESTISEMINLVVSKEIELFISGVVMTSKRFELINYPHPWYFDSMILVIPDPTRSTNFRAVLQPLQFEVWMCVALSPVVVATVLLCLNNILTLITRQHRLPNNRLSRPTDYVVRVLLNQGGYCPSKRLIFRFIIGSWCLATFVLVNVYSSTLISHLSVPVYHPLIRSLNDLVKHKNIKLVVKKDYGIDALFSTTDSGLFKQLGDKLRSDPLSRCQTYDECLKMVQLGSHVFIGNEMVALNAAIDYFQTYGKCGIKFIKEPGFSVPLSFISPKESSFTESINRGILTLQEIGLTNEWINGLKPTNVPCPTPISRKTTEGDRMETRLSIDNLTGAFAILCIGYGLSISAFIVEIAFGRWGRK